jgi:hypothetical protein
MVDSRPCACLAQSVVFLGFCISLCAFMKTAVHDCYKFRSRRVRGHSCPHNTSSEPCFHCPGPHTPAGGKALGFSEVCREVSGALVGRSGLQVSAVLTRAGFHTGPWRHSAMRPPLQSAERCEERLKRVRCQQFTALPLEGTTTAPPTRCAHLARASLLPAGLTLCLGSQPPALSVFARCLAPCCPLSSSALRCPPGALPACLPPSLCSSASPLPRLGVPWSACEVALQTAALLCAGCRAARPATLLRLRHALRCAMSCTALCDAVGSTHAQSTLFHSWGLPAKFQISHPTF